MYVADTSPVQSAVRSHVLHFYFPAARGAAHSLLSAAPAAPDFFGRTRISYVRPETRRD